MLKTVLATRLNKLGSSTTLNVQSSYYGDVEKSSIGYFTKEQINELEEFIKNKVSPKSFNGKVVFLQGTTFPRFKLTDYAKKGGKIKRTKTIDKADCLVIDVNKVKGHINNLNTFGVVKSGEEEFFLTWYSGDASQYSFNGISLTEVKGFCSNYVPAYQKTAIDIIEYLFKVKEEYPNIKIMSVSDLTTEITSNYEVINQDWAEKLEGLLASSDPSAVKLGMTYLTNADISDSLLYSMLLLNKYGYSNMRNNTYYNSVNFKNYLESLHAYGVNSWQLVNNGHNPMEVIKAFLKLPNKKILKSSLDYIHQKVEEYVKGTFTTKNCGFELSNIEIKLNINPEDIIDDLEIEEQEDEESSEEIKETNTNNISA